MLLSQSDIQLDEDSTAEGMYQGIVNSMLVVIVKECISCAVPQQHLNTIALSAAQQNQGHIISAPSNNSVGAVSRQTGFQVQRKDKHADITRSHVLPSVAFRCPKAMQRKKNLLMPWSTASAFLPCSPPTGRASLSPQGQGPQWSCPSAPAFPAWQLNSIHKMEILCCESD